MIERENFIENEISPSELCNFIVDEVFSKYPQFIKILGGADKTKIKLKSNVLSVRRFPKEKGNTKAEYDLWQKVINIYSVNKISMNDIKKNNKLLHMLVHESIHAVLNTSKGLNDICTGCYRASRNYKSIIREAFKFEVSSPKSNGIIGKKIAKEKYFKDMGDKEMGEALNEGLTEWLVKKMLGEKRWKGNYEVELEFIATIEKVKGADTVLTFAAGDYNSMMRILHMRPSEIVVFLKCLDMASKYRNYMTSEERRNLTIEGMKSFYDFHVVSEKIFIEKFLLNEIATVNDLNVSTKLVFKIYNGVATMHQIDKISNKNYGFTSIRYDDVFLKLRENIEDLFVLNSNYVNILKTSNSEIAALFMMYNDFKSDRDGQINGLPDEFNKLMNSKGNIYNTIKNPIYGLAEQNTGHESIDNMIHNNNDEFER